MDLFKKFLKKKVSIQDVLASLEKFSNDTKSLNEISQIASSFFGLNWKFNLEMYITTMDNKDREKYLPLIRNILTFDKAVSLWITAQQVLKGAKPMNSDIMKNIDEYEEYLPKFGVEGVRLLEKLKDKFNIPNDVVILEKKVEEKKDDTLVKDKIEEKSQDIKEEVVDVEEVKEELSKTDKILKKVSNKELEEGVFSHLPKKEVVIEEVKESVVKDSVDSWELSNFVKVYGFISQLREVMSAISLFKNAPSLEEYPYYGFIIDVINYLIVQGDKILSTESEDNIVKYFDGGKSKLEEIVSFYKKQIGEEVVFSESLEDNGNTKK